MLCFIQTNFIKNEKKKCITEESDKKKDQYVLSDQMFRFWYAFIPSANSTIELDKGDVYYEKIVKPRLHSFMGSIFEEICRYYTLRAGIAGELNFFVTQVGNWWGTNLFPKAVDLIKCSQWMWIFFLVR